MKNRIRNVFTAHLKGGIPVSEMVYLCDISTIFFFQWKTDRLTSADSTEDCVSLKEEFTGQMHSVLIDRGKGMTRFNTSKRRQVAWGLYTYK